MSDESQPSLPLDFSVSAADVARWRFQAGELESKAKKLLVERNVILRRVDAAMQLFKLMGVSAGETADDQGGADRDSSPHHAMDPTKGEAEAGTAQAKPSKEKLTFVSEVERIVNEAPMGLPIFEIKTILLSSPIRERLLQSDKGFYHAIDRLAERERIFRQNGRAFSKEALSRYREAVAQGIIEDKPARVQTHSPMGNAIEAIVKTSPGIKGAAIISRLMENPEFRATLTPHNTGAYNVLARLVLRGQLVKVGRGYFPPNSTEVENQRDQTGEDEDDSLPDSVNL